MTRHFWINNKLRFLQKAHLSGKIVLLISFLLLLVVFLYNHINNQLPYPHAALYTLKEGTQSELSGETYISNEKITFLLDLDGKDQTAFNLVTKAYAQDEPVLGEFKDRDKIIQAQLTYGTGKAKAENPIFISYQGGDRYLLTAKKNQTNEFRPGQYQLNIILKKGAKTHTLIHEFSWGVLAINSNRSIYLPDEIAQLFFGVLDEKGNTIFDADLTLKIITPDNSTTILSTSDKSIQKSHEPWVITKKPDYFAEYKVKGIGTYKLSLTAKTKNGEKTIDDSFEVRESVPFDVERTEFPTRIYPPHPYPVKLTIQANESYSGEVIEYIPASFNIKDISNSGKLFEPKENDDTKKIVWNVNLKSGQVYTLNYTINFPHISPEFYLLGPLTIEKFSETRHWQIASDAVATYSYSTCSTGVNCWAYEYDTDALPPALEADYNNANGAEALAADYTAINSSNESRWAVLDPGAGDFDPVLFKMDISETPSQITQLSFTAEGRGNVSGTAYIHVCNVASNALTLPHCNSWTQVTSGAVNATPGADTTISSSVSTNITNYIDGSGNIYWTYTLGTANEFLEIDYVKLDVTTGPKSDLKHYRFRDDSATISANSGWTANEDASNAGMRINRTYRLRIQVANTGGEQATGYTYRLESAARNGASCGDDESFAAVPVTATTEHFEMVDSTQGSFTDNADITSNLLNSTGSGTWANGKAVEDPSNITTSHSLTNGYYTEFEYALKATSNATSDGNYCFRLTNNGAALPSYTVYPQATISSSAVLSNLMQLNNNRSTVVTVGGSTGGDGENNTIHLDFEVKSSYASETFTPKVEVKNTATSFTDSATQTGTTISYNSSEPDRRRGSFVIYDELNKRMVIHAGAKVAGSTHFNDVWTLPIPTIDNPRPQWKQLSPSGTLPSNRYMGSAIYDPVNDRMVTFGGYDTADRNDSWELTLPSSGDGAWLKLTPTGTPPSVRSNIDAVYDPDNQRMIIFGGWGAARYNTTFAFSTSTQHGAWSQLSPSGSAPSIRSDYCSVYDSSRKRMIVIGGTNGSAYYNDVYALTLQNAGSEAWSTISPSGTPPAGRAWHECVYDAANDRVILSLGKDGSTFYGDIWELSLSGTPTWTNKTPTDVEKPMALRTHTGIYDPDGQAMIQCFGEDTTTYTTRFCSYIPLPASGNLTVYGLSLITNLQGKQALAYAYDDVNDRMVVFGGWGRLISSSDIYSSEHLSETWAYSSSADNWMDFNYDSGGPPQREGATMVYDSANDRIILTGGLAGQFDNNFKYFNDVWELKLNSLSGDKPKWRKLNPSGTPPVGRHTPAAVYDSVNQRMILFGGETEAQMYNDVWALSLPSNGDGTWSQLSPTGTPPTAKGHSGYAYDAANNRMIIVGGGKELDIPVNETNEVHALDLDTTNGSWASLPTGPAARRNLTCIYDGAYAEKRVVCFGGRAAGSYNDVWKLVVTTPGAESWTQVTPSGGPPTARRAHAAVYDPDNQQMILYGGRVDASPPIYANDVWTLSLQSSHTSWAWSQKSPSTLVRVTVPVTGLALATNFHWQAWVTGSSSGESDKVSFGGNSDTITADTDFYVTAPATPTPTATPTEAPTATPTPAATPTPFVIINGGSTIRGGTKIGN